jgi:sulfotransferase
LKSKNYYFVAGLPRSGSTLFCNLLAQNPNFRSDAVTSGLASMLMNVQAQWEGIQEFKNWPIPEAKERVMRAMFHAFYEDTIQPVVFDKSRAWLSQLEMLEMILQRKVKVIVMVRDMRAIMASWEKMWRKNKALMPPGMPPEAIHSVEARVQHWGSPQDHTGRAYLSIQDAVNRGFEDRMLFVDFDKLANSPVQQMDRVYSFLGEKLFRHDFDNINQVNVEGDPAPWMRDLHIIRNKLEPVESNWREILGSPAEGLAKSNALWVNRT